MQADTELDLGTLSAEYHSPEKARELLERLYWPNGAKCPHCKADKPYKVKAKTARKGLYKCRECKKQFTVTVGTIFEDSKIPLNKWLLAFFILSSSKKAMSAHQMHRMLGITYKSAWFMCHRIRHAFKPIKNEQQPMYGKLELDETFVGGVGSPKTAVVALIRQGGEVRTKVVDRVTHRNIGVFLRANVTRGSILQTDGWTGYNTVYLPGVKHESVNHSAKEFSRERADGSKVHVNSCETFFSLLKRGVYGSWHHVSKEHLHRYCDEFSFRWNTRKLTDGERFALALPMIAGKRLTYKATIS